MTTGCSSYERVSRGHIPATDIRHSKLRNEEMVMLAVFRSPLFLQKFCRFPLFPLSFFFFPLNQRQSSVQFVSEQRVERIKQQLNSSGKHFS